VRWFNSSADDPKDVFPWAFAKGFEMTRYIHPTVVLFLSLTLLSACGGGSSPAPAASPPPPPVDTELDWDQGSWDQENWQ
jgi:hypothetical protein